jgi:hypothetical protein
MRRWLLLALFLFPLTVYADDGSIVRPVNRAFVGDNELSLRPVLGIGPEFSGREILQLILRGHTDGERGLVAGAIAGADVTVYQTIESGPSQSLIFEIPEDKRRIGDLDFQLHLRGNIVVDSVGVKLVPASAPTPPVPPHPPTPPAPPAPPPSPPPHVPPPPPAPPHDPPPPSPPVPPHNPPPAPPHNPPHVPLPPPPPPPPPPAPPPGPAHATIFVRSYFTDVHDLYFAKLVNFQRYAGRTLRFLTVTGQSHWGDATVTLCLSSGCSGLSFPDEAASFQWPLNERVSSKSADWRLELRGEVFIERIDLDF